MTLKTKFYIFPLFLMIAIAFGYYLNYQNTVSRFNLMFQKHITDTKNVVRKKVIYCDKMSIKMAKMNDDNFRHVHNLAIDILKKENPNITLASLKNMLQKHLSNDEIKIELYLINKDKIIYDTTYKPDLNLDMSKFLTAKKDIELASISSDIVLKLPSIDILKMSTVHIAMEH